MIITITASERSAVDGKGLARDTRVGWAPGEGGQLYEVRSERPRAGERLALEIAYRQVSRTDSRIYSGGLLGL